MAKGSAVRIFASGIAASTLTSDTKAVQATGDEFQTALHLLESEAAAFAKSVIADPAARLDYNKRTKAAVSELIELVKQRKITPHEAARSANAMRNQLMVLARSRLSDFGLAVSRDMKANGRALAELEESYAKDASGLDGYRSRGRPSQPESELERKMVWHGGKNYIGRLASLRRVSPYHCGKSGPRGGKGRVRYRGMSGRRRNRDSRCSGPCQHPSWLGGRASHDRRCCRRCSRIERIFRLLLA